MTDANPPRIFGDPELDRAIDAERARPEPDAAEVDRVLAHVGAVLGLAFLPDPTSPDTPASPPSASAPVATAAGAGAQAAVVDPSVARPILEVLKGWASSSGLPSLLVGVALGAAGHAFVAKLDHAAPRPPGSVQTATAPRPTIESDSTQVTHEPDASAPPVDLTHPAPTSIQNPASTPRPDESAATDSLDSERRLIDAARAAFARGDADAARRFLDRHAARYPRGYFVEDRNVLLERLARRSSVRPAPEPSDPPTEATP